MKTQYGLQSKRLKALQKYAAIVTGSKHMKSEYIRNGLSAEKVFQVSLPIACPPDNSNGMSNGRSQIEPSGNRNPTTNLIGDKSQAAKIETPQPWRLLFLGRLIRPKGPHVFLDAISEVSSILDKPLQVTFAGDGSERVPLERKAAQLQGPNLQIEFVGWVGPSQRDALLKLSDLAVMPSLWPEPFGLVGLEAILSRSTLRKRPTLLLFWPETVTATAS